MERCTDNKEFQSTKCKYKVCFCLTVDVCVCVRDHSFSGEKRDKLYRTIYEFRSCVNSRLQTYDYVLDV